MYQTTENYFESLLQNYNNSDKNFISYSLIFGLMKGYYDCLEHYFGEEKDLRKLYNSYVIKLKEA